MRISDWSSDVCSSDLENGDTAVPSAEFPLMMTPRRTNEMMNSIVRQTPKLGGKKSYNPAFLHPSDMERFGASAGDIIRIHSLHGEILGVATTEPHLRLGPLSMPPPLAPHHTHHPT